MSNSAAVDFWVNGKEVAQYARQQDVSIVHVPRSENSPRSGQEREKVLFLRHGKIIHRIQKPEISASEIAAKHAELTRHDEPYPVMKKRALAHSKEAFNKSHEATNGSENGHKIAASAHNAAIAEHSNAATHPDVTQAQSKFHQNHVSAHSIFLESHKADSN